MSFRSLAFVVFSGLCVLSCGPSRPEPVAPVPDEPESTPAQELRAFGYHGTQPGEIGLERWQSAETCSECHDATYTQWQGTMHSNAGRDPLYLAVMTSLRDNVSSEIERTELRTCTRCHSGAGHLSAGAVDAFSDLGPLTSLDEQGGVFCGFCHVVTGSRPADGGYEVEPGANADDMGVMRGPHGDAGTEGHAVAQSEIHHRAAFCGTCHDQVHAATGVRLQSTYSEWSEGPYNTGTPATTVVCQDCHMRQSAGSPATGSTARPALPGSSAPVLGDMSPQRPHIWAHSVAGANTFVPGLLVADAAAQLATERLQAAATIEIGVPESATPGEAMTIEVRVTNSGAGHSIPTGATDIRQMWIELRVVAPRAGVTVYESGLLSDDGALAEDAHTFGVTFGDAAGQPVRSSIQATQILEDHRVPPHATVAEAFTVTAPQGGGTLEVHARLRYRSASQEMVTTLLGEGQVPVVEMAEASAEIQVGQ